jgi:hypothetical protein
METNIKCPKCDHQFNVESAIGDSVRKQVESEGKEQLNKALEEFRLKKEEIQREKVKLQDDQKSFDSKLQLALSEKEKSIRSKLKLEIESENESSFKALQLKVAEQNDSLSEMKKQKVQFQQQAQELEQQKKDMDLEIQEQVLNQTSLIKEAALKEEREKRDMADKQKDLQLQTLKSQIEDLKRKAEQGSQQSQGEILEIELEELLRNTFPYDTINEVPKGTSGADCIQEVVNSHLKVVGTIAYETKRTKSFVNGWIDKLKSDMRSHKAQIGIIVTESMPKDMDAFGEMNGVWICKFSEVEALSRVLRHGLLQVAQIQIASENSEEKMKLLYDYLISIDFKQNMEAVIHGYEHMKEGIDREKRAMKKLWNQREKELELIIDGATGMYGSIRGIAGSSVLQIKSLELDDDLLE